MSNGKKKINVELGLCEYTKGFEFTQDNWVGKIGDLPKKKYKNTLIMNINPCWIIMILNFEMIGKPKKS